MKIESSKETTSGGIGFFGLLTLIFITLKLTGYIAWSWWWVLSPIWLPITLFLVIVLLIAVGSVLARKRW